MGYLVPVVVSLCLTVRPSFASDSLPSRPLNLPYPTLIDTDVPVEEPEPPKKTAARGDRDEHTVFAIKHHLGFAAGYDYGQTHGAIGYYVTVAEWGRWNFGVPSPELGMSRYPAYDAFRGVTFTKNEASIFVSLASVHYRLGYLRSYGVNWYVNLEQIFDLRQNATGSQIGFSFSPK